MSERRITLDGTSLSCRMVAAVARDRVKVTLAASAGERVRVAHQAAAQVAAAQPVYGRSTGVGANRDVAVGDDAEHCLRLLRSHACGLARRSARRWAGRCWWCGRTSSRRVGPASRHGNFHCATLALALDGTRAALHPTARCPPPG